MKDNGAVSRKKPAKATVKHKDEDCVELYRKYRPQSLDELIGQDQAVKVLSAMIEKRKIPHVFLLSGPSGVGKTTTARILQRELGCLDHEFSEINAAESRGIDTIRDIHKHMGRLPMRSSGCRMWLLDEAAKLSSDAQNALLKMLEDVPSHVYFILATTDPHKLLRTIQTRCCHIQFVPLSDTLLEQLLVDTAQKEGCELDATVVEVIVEASEGSPRQSLVLLQKALMLTDPNDQLAAVVRGDLKRQVDEVCRALLNPTTKWAQLARILREIDEPDPEKVRHIVLSWMTKVLLGAGKDAPRANQVIVAFRENWYDCKRAGLAAACYEIWGSK